MKFLSPSSGYTSLVIVSLCLIGLMTGLNYIFRPFAQNNQVRIDIRENPASPSATPAPYADWSEEAKITQLIIAPLQITESTGSGQFAVNSSSWDWITAHQPGGVIIFGQNLQMPTVASISATLAKLQMPPSWLAVDHEGGSVQRLMGDGFTPLPSWQKLCAQSETDRQIIFDQTAKELSEVGINMIFGPVVDVASRSAILRDRACSSNPETVSLASRQVITAYQASGILAVIKHFPGIGSLTQDLHQRFGVVNPQGNDGMPFHMLLSEFPTTGVMTTFSGVKDICDNQPCALSRACLSPLTTRYPKALLVTDALDMAAAGHTTSASASLNLTERSRLAIDAGNHLLLYGKGASVSEIELVVKNLASLYKTDAIFKNQVDLALIQLEGYKQIYHKRDLSTKESL